MAGKVENKKIRGIWKRELLLALLIALSLQLPRSLGRGSEEDNAVSRTDNFVNVNVFNSVTSPRVLSYRRCVLLYQFLNNAVSLNFNLTFGLKPQVGGIKIVTV